jgi:hypothetical protein
MRYVRAFLRPAFSEKTPVIHLVIIRTGLCILLAVFILWELILYPVYMKGATWSMNDVDYVAWILKPSSWSTLNILTLEIQLIYAATFILESKENPNPVIESECLNPRLYLRIQNQFIVAKPTSMILFIVYMHSVQFNSHKDHAEEACTIMGWIIMMFELLYNAIPAHFRDIMISQFVIALVIAYLCIMSASGVSIYTGINLREIETQSIKNIGIIFIISIWIDIIMILLVKAKSKCCSIRAYSPPRTEETIRLEVTQLDVEGT